MTPSVQRRLSAIMSADVVGFSRLMEQDEVGTLGRLQNNRRDIVLPRIAAHGGRVVKLMGDGSLVEFPSIVSAVACAVEIQSAMSGVDADRPTEQRLRYRIGLNLGDVMIEGEDIYGDGVNVAARLQEVAEPGGIALSSSVKDHISGKLPLILDDRGERQLKNIERPIQVYTVRSEGLETAAVPLNDHARPGQAKRVALCVLPFSNMSGDIEQDYFSDGITEDIITDLSKISALAVIARNTAFAMKGKTLRLEQIARDLKVDFILEGSVRKAGNRVRITAQLIDGTNNFHVWADRFDRTLEDVFAIQDEISKNIVAALKLELLPNEQKAIAARPAVNAQAYEIYLIARSLFYQGQQLHTLKTARRLFAKALEVDPDFARAYAGHAICDCFLLLLNDSAADPKKVLDYARRAQELEPGLAHAHVALAQAYHMLGRKQDAETEFSNALILDVNSFDAHYLYALHCHTWGDHARSAALYEKAAALSPDDYRAPNFAAASYFALGQIELANELLREGFQRVESALSAHPDNVDALAFGAVILARLEDVDRGISWAARATLLNDENPMIFYNLACFYSLIGKLDESLDCLLRISSATPLNWLEWIKQDVDLEPLRHLPRYRDFIGRLESEGERIDPSLHRRIAN